MDNEEYNYQPYEEALAQALEAPSQPAKDLKDKGFVQLEFHPNFTFWMKKKDCYNYKRFLTLALLGLPFSIALTFYLHGVEKDLSLLDTTTALIAFPSIFSSIHFFLPDKTPDVLYYFVREDPPRDWLERMARENG